MSVAGDSAFSRGARGDRGCLLPFAAGAGLISTTDNAGAPSYYLADGLGSTAQLVTSTGALTGDAYTYDVFGAPRTVTGGTANDFRFTGQQADAKAARGLYYLRARHYDPKLLRDTVKTFG